MIRDTETDTVPPQRDSTHGRRHLYSGIILLLILAVFELTIGSSLQDRDLNTKPGATHWSRMTHQLSGLESEKELILYISNSHAKTGGNVAVHLQHLLDELHPDRYQVMDLAAPGIFAPEMLQRVLLGMQNKPDVVIMAVAYISFSDRMKLALQSHSVRSFFKPGVFEHLSGGFWLRNYDIGLYLDTLLKQKLNIFRYRNQLRDLWERPAVDYLKTASDSQQILFLEVDESERWKFPDGYDNNLFDWRLYSGDRQGHLADLSDAIEFINSRDVPLLGINLPVHWEKSVYEHHNDDYQAYRKELAGLFSGSLEYVDYQDVFPSEFTTYDALHPTWHGARLHALDITLRLQRQGILSGHAPESIADVFTAMDDAVSETYRAGLSGEYERLNRGRYMRYDLFEPDNATILMRQLTSFPVGSYTNSNHLYDLSLRLRYWQEQQFDLPVTEPGDHHALAFSSAVRSEIDRSRQRAAIFQQQLVDHQSRRLQEFPLPDLDTATLTGRRALDSEPGTIMFLEQFQLSDKQVAMSVRLADGREIARGLMAAGKRPGFIRVDVLGDGSFLLLQDLADPIRLPTWVTHTEPFVQFGI